MLDIQLGRHNLSPIQRIAIAEKYRSIYEKQARENSLNNLKQNQISEKSNLTNREKTKSTNERLASVAGVSTDTYSKGKKTLDSDNEEVKEKVLSSKIVNWDRISKAQNGLLNYLNLQTWRE